MESEIDIAKITDCFNQLKKIKDYSTIIDDEKLIDSLEYIYTFLFHSKRIQVINLGCDLKFGKFLKESINFYKSQITCEKSFKFIEFVVRFFNCLYKFGKIFK